MIPKVADKRRDGKSSFVQLVTYVTIRDDVKMSETLSPDTPFVRSSRSNESSFSRLINYIDRESEQASELIIAEFPDGRQQVRSGEVVCETNCFSLQSAAAEMNAIAAQCRRAEDPVYHFLLSWPVVDEPQDEAIFSSARECLKQLGMTDHQYVTAIHRDTNHVHCHVAVNKVNPVSYRVAKLWNDFDTLHKTCRRLELKHQWMPTNGAWVAQDGVVVRPERAYKNGPTRAAQLEYYADQESLFSYAVEQCREDLNAIFHEKKFTWNMLHDVLISAGLELRRKGNGLAVYDNSDNPLPVPIKASHLHPALTLSCLEPRIGAFTVSPVAEKFDANQLVYARVAENHYNPSLHARDHDARAERREARAEARDDLKARYKAYRNAWVRPSLPGGTAKERFQALSAEFAQRKKNVRQLPLDPLLKKMLYHGIVADRMIAMAALRVQMREERAAMKAAPEYRCMTYPQWVAGQALEQDMAARSQLRGWAYRAKRNTLTPAISTNTIRCAVADDIPAFIIDGYDTYIHRDGTVSYNRDGKAVILDRGERIEIADPRVNNGQDVITAFCLAEQKSGERVEIRGDKAFVQQAISMVPGFNQSGHQPLPLTHPLQRQWAGYDVRPDNVPDPISRVPSGPKYTPPKPQ